MRVNSIFILTKMEVAATCCINNAIFIVFDEGLREINDRMGGYDETVGKWVKQSAKPDAYKADYSKARL